MTPLEDNLTNPECGAFYKTPDLVSSKGQCLENKVLETVLEQWYSNRKFSLSAGTWHSLEKMLAVTVGERIRAQRVRGGTEPDTVLPTTVTQPRVSSFAITARLWLGPVPPETPGRTRWDAHYTSR